MPRKPGLCASSPPAFRKPCLERLEDRCLLSGDVVVELPIPPGFGHPVDIAAGPDGNLWFTETVPGLDSATSSYVGRITPAGQVTEFSIPAEGTPFGSGGGGLQITAGPDGNLWFTESSSYSKVAEISPSGGITVYHHAGISEPEGIVAGSDGALWFTNDEGDSIGRITTKGDVHIYRHAGIKRPWGIAGGPDGAIWFTNPVRNTIGRITTEGVVTIYADPRIHGPQGIVAGPDGALWFANHYGRSIGRITTRGSVRILTG